jgi:hypothetical protein
MKVLLLTPPFTQLNTPYPATMYIKGYLNTLGIESFQADLSIEVINSIFSKDSLTEIFKILEDQSKNLNENGRRILSLSQEYINTIDRVIAFLQGSLDTLAYQIADRSFLPEASRFINLEELDFSFGNLGIIDRAKHLCTLYLEDLGDVITEYIDPHFGFNRYAESIGRTASNFDVVYKALMAEDTLVTNHLIKCLKIHLNNFTPDMVCITVPFPGNLFAGLKCGQFLKKILPNCKIIIGGGYVNTELRRIADERFFEFIDFVSYDDGEAPLQILIDYLKGNRPISELKRMTTLHHGVVQHINGAKEKDIAQRETGTPDYNDLYLEQYLSMLEVTNPMHRLWSDGRWNKLTLAHGCYWGKCSFCDVSLDYIGRYEPIDAKILCDRIEEIIAQTNETGFHFVDEAAPPSLMGELALEIIKRKIQITWWTNIRFEKSFTPSLCRLLRASGCIAVTGGLEVASDRLLSMMEKGVTVEQVANVCNAFTSSNIMVHAYLMYGFPTQTDQETIDSLEVVRQLFEAGVLKSGFWHRFAMTAHSPVGLTPEKYKVLHTGPVFEGFAENDYFHEDPRGGDHDAFSEGLKISLYNYMNGAGLDLQLHKWFDHRVPKTSLPKKLIQTYLQNVVHKTRSNAKIIYIGYPPMLEQSNHEFYEIKFFTKQSEIIIDIDPVEGKWLLDILPKISVANQNPEMLLSEFKNQYENETDGDFEDLMESDLWPILQDVGLIVF